MNIFTKELFERLQTFFFKLLSAFCDMGPTFFKEQFGCFAEWFPGKFPPAL